MSQPSTRPTLYKGYRFPPEIISGCVWLYYRFGVSLRDVSELMLARGIEVSHEAIRLWTLRFGTEYARRLRRTRGACSNTWHLDELCLMINGERGWLWRAVDDAGEVLDILVQRRRSAVAASRFLRKLVKGLRMVPYAIVTDRLPSCAAAKAVVLPTVSHLRGWRQNNRVETRTNLSATAHPTAEWTIQQLRDGLPLAGAYRLLVHDRDGIFAPAVDDPLHAMSLRVLKTPVRAPQANPARGKKRR